VRYIEDSLGIQELSTALKNKDVFMYCIPTTTYKHPCCDSLSLLFILDIQERETFAVIFNHIDSQFNVNLSDIIPVLNLTRSRFVVDKKSFKQYIDISDLLDVKFLAHAINKDFSINPTSVHTFYKYQFPKCNTVNRIVPINKHYETFEKLYSNAFEILKTEHNKLKLDAYINSNNILTDTLYQIEKNGICVNPGDFIKSFKEDSVKLLDGNLIRSQYNLFTSTGRPSNKFGGINFAALNKKDDSRKCFVSRFGTNGKLFDFDFSAFHPHLISNLVNYDLEFGTNIYEYLGKHYLSKDNLTELELAHAKTLTFRQLYGNVEPKYKYIPYFKKWMQYIEQRWSFFLENGYVETPIYSRQITLDHIGDDVNPSKLSNYILQAYETEVGLTTVSRILNLLKNKKSKVILYTYDSILIDFHKDDSVDCLHEIKNAMENNKKFPVKIKAGDNYKEMFNVNI
jgi:hypothetical protein